MLKLGSKEHLGLLQLFTYDFSMLPDSAEGLTVESSRFMTLGGFILPLYTVENERAQEFCEVAIMELTQITKGQHRLVDTHQIWVLI